MVETMLWHRAKISTDLIENENGDFILQYKMESICGVIFPSRAPMLWQYNLS
jgi:hypothetical protein